MKNNKAITLISLIITIIVLLILAGVTINMVLGENGIINKSKTSVGKYSNEQDLENSTLIEYEQMIDEYSGGIAPSTLKYTVSYNANGGTGTIEDDIGESIILAEATGLTAPTGKHFIEWNTSADGSGTSYAPGDEVSSNMTLYAMWLESWGQGGYPFTNISITQVGRRGFRIYDGYKI